MKMKMKILKIEWAAGLALSLGLICAAIFIAGVIYFTPVENTLPPWLVSSLAGGGAILATISFYSFSIFAELRRNSKAQ